MFFRLLHSAVETEVTEFSSVELAIEWIAEKQWNWGNCTLIEFYEESVTGRIYNGFELREMHDGTPIPSSDS
jgi:hypothetical protein